MRQLPWGILLMFATLAVAFALAGLWWWLLFLGGLILWLGIVELWAVRRTGLTLSAQYTKLVREKPLVGALLHAMVGALFGYLLYHLATGW